MKKQLAALCLFALAFAALPQPARADFSMTFGRHDINHDGRWDYNEFRDANNDYYRHHKGVQVISDKVMRGDFDRLDVGHHGYLMAPEVQSYRTWD